MEQINISYPPEWYPQEYIQLAWPDIHTDWADILPEVRSCVVEIIQEVAYHANVLLLCKNVEAVKEILNPEVLHNVKFIRIPYNDTWCRDYGGITVFEDNKAVVLDFAFNGWGMKFAANYDNCVTRSLFALGYLPNRGIKNYNSFVLEGGSIESDGNGSIMTTSVCLLSANRNDGLTKDEIEAELKSKLGAQQILWLENGELTGDDTDGHIDTLARFAPNNKIVYCVCNNYEDEHYVSLKKMEAEIKNLKNIKGEPYETFPVPLPSGIFDNEERLPATYVNYLILNKQILVPTYGVAEDEVALKIIADAHPSYTIKGINCLPLIKQHGSLHCITMNYPKLPVN